MAAQFLEPVAVPLRQAELLVFARVAARWLAGRPTLAPGGRTAGRGSGEGTDFLDYREYVPGDDVRHVDWRASARSARTMIRSYRRTNVSEWYLCIDRSASMAIGDQDKWRAAVRLAAAMAYLLLHLDNRVGMLLFSDGVDALCRAGRGHLQYARLCRLLEANAARQRGGKSELGACEKYLGRGAGLVVVSDFLAGDGMQSALDRLRVRRRPIHALQLVSAVEFRIPAASRFTLEDVESAEQFPASNGAFLAGRAEARFLHLQAQLAAYCAANDIVFSAARSDADWRSVLMRHFSARPPVRA